MHLTIAGSPLQRLAALALLLALAGCRPAPPPDDTSLNALLQSKLSADAAIAAEPIQTFVERGTATLQGTVSSEAAKALAASDAAQVPGIKFVSNQLTVNIAGAAPQASNQVTPPAAVSPLPPLPARPAKPSARIEALPQQARAPLPPAQPAPIERRQLVPDSNQQPGQQAANAPPNVPSLEHRPTPPPPPPAAPAFRNVTLPVGTTLSVRLTQTLDSATTQPGDPFAGTLASDVLVDGLVAFRAGTTVSGKVDVVHEAAHFKGSALLTISLVSVNHRGDPVRVSTDPFTKEGTGRGKNTAEKVGGGAAVGAILGGILGGGRGAAIGAATGGGVGAGAQGITRGQQVQIPSETLVSFRLSSPLDVRAATGEPVAGEPNLQHHPSN